MPDDPPNEKATPEPKKESTTKMSTRMQLAIHIVALLSVLLLCGTLYGVCSNDTDTTNKKKKCWFKYTNKHHAYWNSYARW